MASSNFPIIRGADAQQSRVQDNLTTTITPVARALQGTPIMGAAPSAWIRPTLLSGFANFGLGDAVAGYRKDALGQVWGKGNVVTAAGSGAVTQVYLLPLGYRPSETMRFAVRGNGAAVQFLAVTPSGQVFAEVAIAAGGTCSLNFSFLAE